MSERIAHAVADLGSECYMEVDRLRNVVAGLEADLREEQDRRQAMRTEWAAEVAALDAKIDALRSDRDCEKRLRKDAEDAREDATELCAALTAQARHAEDCLDAAKARIAALDIELVQEKFAHMGQAALESLVATQRMRIAELETELERAEQWNRDRS